MKGDQVSRLGTRLIKMLHARPSRDRKCVTSAPLENCTFAIWGNNNGTALSAVAVVQERAHLLRGLRACRGAEALGLHTNRGREGKTARVLVVKDGMWFSRVVQYILCLLPRVAPVCTRVLTGTELAYPCSKSPRQNWNLHAGVSLLCVSFCKVDG